MKVEKKVEYNFGLLYVLLTVCYQIHISTS